MRAIKLFTLLNKTFFKEALLHLSAAKLRSTLALLGILVGTASVVAMVSSGQLATAEALKQFELLGTDLLAVTLNEKSQDDQSAPINELSLSQAENLTSADGAILDLAPYTQSYLLWRFNAISSTGVVLGVTERFAHITHIALEQGRFISKLDKFKFYCVVGNKLYQQIQKSTFKKVLGSQIMVGDAFFTIVGVAKPWPENSFVYTNIDTSIMVPVLTSTQLQQSVTINNIILQLRPHTNSENVQAHLLQSLHRIVPDKEIFFRSAKELVARMSKQSHIFTVFLGLIGSISLMVGGIGVMNIMLVSVVERRREIGVRLAMGASSRDIWGLFLIEAVILSLAGGSLGVIIGTLIAYIMALVWHWHFVFYALPATIGFVVSIMVGIFFGSYPAYQASRLDPVQALRG